MAKNEFLPFGTAANANVLPNADYQALPARSAGFSSGVAKSEQLNTVWRQASLMSSALGQFIADTTGKDVLDNGDVAELKKNFADAVGGRLLRVRRFTASGTYTPTLGTKFVIVEAIGGGGAGAGAITQTGYVTTGSGGAGGSFAKVILNDGFNNVSITIGKGGVGGLTEGGAGGETSFGTIIKCPGGNGGGFLSVRTDSMGVSPQGVKGGEPEISMGAVIYASSGCVGASGMALAGVTVTGVGANSPYGSGGGNATEGDGARAAGFGSGGSGGAAMLPSIKSKGGDGAAGIIIIYEYS